MTSDCARFLHRTDFVNRLQISCRLLHFQTLHKDKMKKKCLSYCFFMVIFLLLLYFYWLEPMIGRQTNKATIDNSKRTKLVLIYTTLFGNPVWHGIQETKSNTYLKDIGCKYKCKITYNKTMIADADAVVFHARDVENERNGRYSSKVLEVARNIATRRQKWIFLSHENPQYDPSIYAPYNQLFNWTATFSRRSDVFIPYGKYKKSPSEQPLKNYAQGKTGLVAWAVSNCGLMRQDYVMELQHYINVTVYGRCRHNFIKQENCDRSNPDCRREISRYKFYLAFENNFCHDYVTEKYWGKIHQETVPVVMGATYDEGLVIPGSYIDSSKFDSIKALADYLLYLNSNDSAYNEYFSWKSHYTTNVGAEGDLHCEVCTEVYSEKFEKTTLMTLSDVFNAKKTCQEPFSSKYDKFVQQIQASKKLRQL